MEGEAAKDEILRVIEIGLLAAVDENPYQPLHSSRGPTKSPRRTPWYLTNVTWLSILAFFPLVVIVLVSLLISLKHFVGR
jgi:hypothetical protein